jgi:hypothetical protein
VPHAPVTPACMLACASQRSRVVHGCSRGSSGPGFASGGAAGCREYQTGCPYTLHGHASRVPFVSIKAAMAAADAGRERDLVLQAGLEQAAVLPRVPPHRSEHPHVLPIPQGANQECDECLLARGDAGHWHLCQQAASATRSAGVVTWAVAARAAHDIKRQPTLPRTSILLRCGNLQVLFRNAVALLQIATAANSNGVAFL